MSQPRLLLQQQSDGRWLWIRENGQEAIHLGWLADQTSIVGAFASRMKRPLIDAIAACVRAETGLEVVVTGRSV